MQTVDVEKILEDIKEFETKRQQLIEEATKDATEIAAARQFNAEQARILIDAMTDIAEDKLSDEMKFYSELYKREYIVEKEEDEVKEVEPITAVGECEGGDCELAVDEANPDMLPVYHNGMKLC